MEGAMGRWVRADAIPVGGISIEGDPWQTVPKNWTQRWRFRWKWTILSVGTDKPFHLHFESDGVRMRFTETLRCKWVVLRVGRAKVRFAAIAVSDGSEIVLQRGVFSFFTTGLFTKRELLNSSVFMTACLTGKLRWL